MKAPSQPPLIQSAVNIQNQCRFNFVDGASVEITGSVACRYRVEFIDGLTSKIIHQGEISHNQWIKTTRQYFTPWIIKIYRQQDQKLLVCHHFNARQQRIYIAIESKALGDTIAWFQAVEDFQRVHQCELICSTFMNDLFRAQYPDIQFVEPGETVENLYAMFRIGWFYTPEGNIDYNKNVSNFRLQTLGATATDILGLPYFPRSPRLQLPSNLARPIPNQYVCIAIHATAQAKYWNNSNGWPELVKYLRQQHYKVVLLSREGQEFMGNVVPEGLISLPPGNLSTIINYLQHASLFIGIGSGLTWLSWAVGCKTCLISGFSEPYTEVADLIRISTDANHCSGCFNRQRLNAVDWNWCPDHQYTTRQYECTRSISAQQVINQLEKHLPKPQTKATFNNPRIRNYIS